MVFEHTSVMPREIHDNLALKPGHYCVDCTLGGSGHARTIVQSVLPGGKLIGIDQDQAAIENARSVLEPFLASCHIVHDNFSNLPVILGSLNISGVDGILLDLGLSLHQLRQSGRGFSFQKDEPLDMRMDVRNRETAADIVNTRDEKDLADLFYVYGEERYSRRIAREIVRRRESTPFRTSRELATAVIAAIPAKYAHSRKIHPATQVFQALRIVVNRELDMLDRFLKTVPSLLNPGGRLCVISFHSLEDRRVKQALRGFESGCSCPREFPRCVCGFEPQLRVLTRKPLVPSFEEITANPMARSARLRVAEKV